MDVNGSYHEQNFPQTLANGLLPRFHASVDPNFGMLSSKISKSHSDAWDKLRLAMPSKLPKSETGWHGFQAPLLPFKFFHNFIPFIVAMMVLFN